MREIDIARMTDQDLMVSYMLAVRKDEHHVINTLRPFVDYRFTEHWLPACQSYFQRINATPGKIVSMWLNEYIYVSTAVKKEMARRAAALEIDISDSAVVIDCE